MAFATTRQLRDLTERVEELQKLVLAMIPAAGTVPPRFEQEVTKVPEVPEEEGAHEQMVSLLGERYTALLEDAGYTSLTQLKETPSGDLTAIVGIGDGVVKRIQDGKKKQ